MQRLLLTLAVLGFPVLAFAQDGGGASASVDWNEIIAYAINTAGVFTSVRLITHYAKGLSDLTKQILALAGGPVLMTFLQPMISAALGYPIDLSLVAGALAGLASSLTAMASYDFAKISGGGK